MSAITPQTDLKLLKCPIESDNRNQLTFTSVTAQRNYFNSLPKLKVDNFTYQRKDSVIRYPAHIDTILEYNYVMYQNEAYSNKWFYAFITKMEYVNDNMTLITIKTDVYQTWMFDIVWKRSFIEREHVNDDTIGLHTIPEGLETGAYKVYEHQADSYNSHLCYITLSTVGPSDLESYDLNVYNGIITPGVYCKWDSTTMNDLKTFINALNRAGKIDALVSMFIAPQWLAESSGVYVNPSSTVPLRNIDITRITDLDGYVPHNNKMLCYPYCFINLSNAMGIVKTYKQERWNPNNPNAMGITMKGVLTPGGSIRVYPVNYNGERDNFDESITLGKFPQVAWYNDLYTNWQTQNGVNIAGIPLTATESAIGKGILQLGIGASMVASGNIIGGQFIGGGISDIYGAVQENYQHSLIPNAVEGNINSGDVSTMMGINRLHYYKMGVTQEYAKICDRYMDLYGYKVNTVKMPNITGRANWNYVKTIGANIEGNIPEEDLNEIKSLFNTGITLWHNPSTYLDYSQSNSIV